MTVMFQGVCWLSFPPRLYTSHSIVICQLNLNQIIHLLLGREPTQHDLINFDQSSVPTSANTGMFGEHAQQRPVCFPPNFSLSPGLPVHGRTGQACSKLWRELWLYLNIRPYKQLALRLSSCFVQRLKSPHQTIESNSAKYEKPNKIPM
jgi:hypothetical protein